jgi:hypothetical protein
MRYYNKKQRQFMIAWAKYRSYGPDEASPSRGWIPHDPGVQLGSTKIGTRYYIESKTLTNGETHVRVTSEEFTEFEPFTDEFGYLQPQKWDPGLFSQIQFAHSVANYSQLNLLRNALEIWNKIDGLYNELKDQRNKLNQSIYNENIGKENEPLLLASNGNNHLYLGDRKVQENERKPFANNNSIEQLGVPSISFGMAIGAELFDGATIRFFNKKGTNFSPKIYSPGWGGGSVGRIKTYKTSGLALKLTLAGKLLSAYNITNAVEQRAKGEITDFQFAFDELANVLSFTGGTFGAAYSLGWEVGRWISQRPGYNEYFKTPMRKLYKKWGIIDSVK